MRNRSGNRNMGKKKRQHKKMASLTTTKLFKKRKRKQSAGRGESQVGVEKTRESNGPMKKQDIRGLDRQTKGQVTEAKQMGLSHIRFRGGGTRICRCVCYQRVGHKEKVTRSEFKRGEGHNWKTSFGRPSA